MPSMIADSMSATPPLQQLQFAGLARRIAAFIPDFLIVSLVQLVVCMPLFIAVHRLGRFSETQLDYALTIVAFAIAWLYNSGLEASPWQATVGKKLLGIQVVDLQGGRVGFWRASARFFAKLFSALMFIGFIIIDFTPKKQGLHDIVAGCLVVRKSKTLNA